MKKYIFTLGILMFAFVYAHAQQYLRYHMNDNTFNGFYTGCIEKVTHETILGKPSACIYSRGKKIEIPLNKVDSVSIESAYPNNENIGNYRIYEFTPENDNIKKVYFDNRASLLASANGDFCENDTIIYSSAYNDTKLLLFTDSKGRVRKIFNGNKLLYLDYNTDDDFTILDVVSKDTLHCSTKSEKRKIKSRANTVSWTNRFVDFVNDHGSEINTMLRDDRMNGMLNFVQNLDYVKNNPELHNQVLIADGIIVASDLASVIASLLAELPSTGWSTIALLYNLNSLRNDLMDLLNNLSPDTDQMNIYKDYYKNKYSISIKVLPSENKSFTSAKLCGELKSNSKLTPICSFKLFGDNDKVINGQISNSSEDTYKITGNASGLTPGSYYFYYVDCTYNVDGLELSYSSDKYAEFYTPTPQVETLSYQNNGPNSTTVYGKCSYDWGSYFENLAEPKVGFAYSEDGTNWAFVTSRLNFDDNFSANLLDIDCMTSYRYKAYVEIDGIKHYGTEKSFVSAPPSLDGIWTCTDSSSDHEDSYTISISNNYATWSNTMVEGGEVWFGNGVNFTISEKWVSTNSSVFWNTWAFSGTLNNKNHPTLITGRIVHSTGNWLHSNETI